MFDTFPPGFASTPLPSGRDLVKKMQETHREISQLQARFYTEMLAVAHAGAAAMPELVTNTPLRKSVPL